MKINKNAIIGYLKEVFAINIKRLLSGGNHQVEGAHNDRAGVRCEHCQIISQLSHQHFRVFS